MEEKTLKPALAAIDPVGDARAQAIQVLEADRQERGKTCTEEVNATLKKYGCALVPVAILRGNELRQHVEIQAQ